MMEMMMEMMMELMMEMMIVMMMGMMMEERIMLTTEIMSSRSTIRWKRMMVMMNIKGRGLCAENVL
eukprot:210378-Hanusia_phi.AAC.1